MQGRLNGRVLFKEGGKSRIGEVHKQAKKERDLQYPPVRTEQAQCTSYLLQYTATAKKTICGDVVDFFIVCFRLNLFHVVRRTSQYWKIRLPRSVLL